MSIQVKWVEGEENILLWHFTGQWSLDEFRHATNQTLALIEDIDSFDLIFDALGAKTPRFPMSEFQRALKIPVLKRDLLVIVTDDLFILSVLSVLRRLGLPNLRKDRMEIVKRLPDAFVKIRARRDENFSMAEPEEA